MVPPFIKLSEERENVLQNEANQIINSKKVRRKQAIKNWLLWTPRHKKQQLFVYSRCLLNRYFVWSENGKILWRNRKQSNIAGNRERYWQTEGETSNQEHKRFIKECYRNNKDDNKPRKNKISLLEILF